MYIQARMRAARSVFVVAYASLLSSLLVFLGFHASAWPWQFMYPWKLSPISPESWKNEKGLTSF